MTTTSRLEVVSRVTGLAYLLVIFDALATLIFVDAKTLVEGNTAETIQKIVAHETLFRAGVFANVLMFLLVVIVAVGLYLLLEGVDKTLATLALFLRFGEAVIGAVGMMLGGLAPLALIKDPAGDTRQLHSLVALFLGIKTISIDIALVFMGVGGVIFCYLLVKSRFVPKALAAWGIVTYATMLAVGTSKIFYPALPVSVFLALSAPGILFEIVFGFWLLLRGVADQTNRRSNGRNEPETS